MVAIALVQRLTLNIALVAAAALAGFVALVMLLLPGAVIEQLVVTSGIAAIVTAAEPPLGITARICITVFAGGGAGLIGWFALSTIVELRNARMPGEGARRPAVRRADAHPDAPPREPLMAGRDLGFDLSPRAEAPTAPLDLTGNEFATEPMIAMAAAEPVPPVPLPVEPPVQPQVQPPVQPMPADLDQPMSAFDPGALLDTPFTPPPPIAPLRRRPARPPIFEARERFETFEITPPARVQPAPPPEPAPAAAAPIATAQTTASVHALLDRLERGMSGRHRPEQRADERADDPPEPHSLEDTLDALRRMAVRA